MKPGKREQEVLDLAFIPPSPPHRTYHRIADIVKALRRFRQDKSNRKTVHTLQFTNYLIDYFRRFDEIYKPEFPKVDDIGHHRGELLLRAITTFEESNEAWVRKYRDKYENFWQRYPAKLGVYTEQVSIEGLLARDEFRLIMEKAMPERQADYTILNGAWCAVDIYFNKFVEKVYVEKGMHEAIMNAKVRGVGGVFGKTKLLTYDIIGRTMLTFSRGDDAITFIKSSKDKFAFTTGVQSCQTDLITALTMLEDVIQNYDPAGFKEDKDISIV